MSTSLLIPENPLIVLPTLAKMIGINGAIFVQQIHFLLNIPKCGREHNGERWLYNTYEEWQDEFFPFWSIRTIKRICQVLEEMHIVETCQPEGRHSRRKYYRLNHGMVAKLIAENCPKEPFDPDGAKFVPSQFESPDGANLSPSGNGPKVSLQSGQKCPFLISETSKTERRHQGTGIAIAPQKSTHQRNSEIGSNYTARRTTIAARDDIPEPVLDDDDPAPELLPAAKPDPKRKARGTKEEFEEFAKSIGLLASDGEAIFWKLVASDWKNGRQPVKDWKAMIRQWKASGWMPSQKGQKANGSNGHAVDENRGIGIAL